MQNSPRILLPSLLLLLSLTIQIKPNSSTDPSPTPWPDQFHALLYLNLSDGHLQITNLWYDWPKGLNLNLIQKQLGVLLYDVEWNNGTTFYYTLGDSGTCEVRQFDVGIPRRDWLAGSTYLGRRYTDGFLCDVWEKVEFIWYYEDVSTRLPVRWDFYDGISTHVITFEVGASLEGSEWQAPPYCFFGTVDDRLRNKQGNASDLMDLSLRKLK